MPTSGRGMNIGCWKVCITAFNPYLHGLYKPIENLKERDNVISAAIKTLTVLPLATPMDRQDGRKYFSAPINFDMLLAIEEMKQKEGNGEPQVIHP